MALAQSTTNFLFFSANADTTGSKQIFAAGLLIVRTAAAAGKVQVRNAASAYNIIPPFVFAASAPPVLLNMVFPNGQLFPTGLKSTFMSGATMIVYTKA
jgi:hypothetical protein